MIIKNLTLKTGTVKPLIRYLFKYALSKNKQIDYTNKGLFVYRHNLRSRSVDGYVKEWNENRTRRIHKRRNGIVANHIILSWHYDDAHKISDAMLKSMAKEFIRLRGDDNLFLFSKHTDRRHVHLHCIHSASTLAGISNRMSKADFGKLKIEMDKFQQLHFPELVNSLPLHGTNKDNYFGKQRDGRFPQKEQLRQVINEAFKDASSVTEFLELLKNRGYEIYNRAGKPAGIQIEGGRKFRFRLFGYRHEDIAKLDDQYTKEAKELAGLRELRNRFKSKERIKTDQEYVRERTIVVKGYGAFPTRCNPQEG